ncbi:C protein [Hipposideros bat paramyxovirus]|nr:C protein [Hipposideros bat paramyxovirus]
MVSRLLSLFKKTEARRTRRTEEAPSQHPAQQTEPLRGNCSSTRHLETPQDRRGRLRAKMEQQKMKGQYLKLVLQKFSEMFPTQKVLSVKPMKVEITIAGMLQILLNQMGSGPLFIYRTLHLLIEDGILSASELMNLRRAIKVMVKLLAQIEELDRKQLAVLMVRELREEEELNERQ